VGLLVVGVMTALTQDQPEPGQGRSHLMDAAVAFGLRVASAGLVFLVQVFLARAMTMDDYGSYITAWTWLVMLGAFMPLGFSESAVRFVPRYRARGRHGSAAAFWRFGLRVVLLMSLLVAGFAVIAATAGGLLDSRVGLILLIVAAGLPFLAIDNFLEGTTQEGRVATKPEPTSAR
jgi:O-antigen/teichoic acid export membrane protein